MGLPDHVEPQERRDGTISSVQPLHHPPTPGWATSQIVLRTPPSPALKNSTNRVIDLMAATPTNTKKTIMPVFSTYINWSLTANSPLFDDDNECDHIRRTLGPKQSVFFDHPVRYLPLSQEQNIYRTVMIDHIPVSATIADVLREIRTGQVESIQLFDRIGNVTDFKTARVVFVYENPAREIQIEASLPGVFIQGRKVHVWIVLQPTYPRSSAMGEAILNQGYTRLLVIGNVSPSTVARLDRMLFPQKKMGFIVDVRKTDDGKYDLVEFTSIAEAIDAMKTLSLERGFENAVFDFQDDYCEPLNG